MSLVGDMIIFFFNADASTPKLTKHKMSGYFIPDMIVCVFKKLPD